MFIRGSIIALKVKINFQQPFFLICDMSFFWNAGADLGVKFDHALSINESVEWTSGWLVQRVAKDCQACG
jgi:hypothetical protein